MDRKARVFARFLTAYVTDLFVLQQISAAFLLVTVLTLSPLSQINQIGGQLFYELLFVQIFTNIGNSRERFRLVQKIAIKK